MLAGGLFEADILEVDGTIRLLHENGSNPVSSRETKRILTE
jgi:hypothetical protein